MKATTGYKIFDAIKQKTQGLDIPGLVRKVLIAWLLAVLVEYLLLPGQWRNLADLDCLAQVSGGRMLAVAIAAVILLIAFSYHKKSVAAERWALVTLIAGLGICALSTSFSWAFLWAWLLAMAIAAIYGWHGWDSTPEPVKAPQKPSELFGWLTVGIAAAGFLFISVWSVSKVNSFYATTYDFGIFAQMFHNMKETGLPMTTLERDGWMSHFDIHVSLIYYLMLPVFMLVPTPATLQVLQAAVMASALLPLWKIGKHHGLSGLQRMLLCAALMVFPAFSGGAAYDLHENCFLTALILWLLYGIDRKNTILTAVTAVLTLTVKEDAAVYVAVIALWLLIKTLVRRKNADGWSLIMGSAMLVASLGWFLAATWHLNVNGEGVMAYRYDNFFYDGSGSLVAVLKAVLRNPMKAVYECVEPEKWKYIALTLLPLLGLPLLTRRYERFLLLIPYVLINLMSDYPFQHDVFFQYNFGSAGLLFYLAAINLAELKLDRVRTIAAGLALALGLTGFIQVIYPEAMVFYGYAGKYGAHYRALEKALDTIPEDASVAASMYYTVYLSQRETIYDVYYCSQEHLLEAEYVALEVDLAYCYHRYATLGQEDGYERLIELLEENGYELYHAMGEVMVIYRRSN